MSPRTERMIASTTAVPPWTWSKGIAGLAVLALILGLEGTLSGCQVRAQVHTAEVGDRPSCDSCRISFELIAEFGNTDDDGMILSRFMSVYALPEGRWLSTDVRDRGAFRFYDPSGRFTERIVASGQGPGEYQGVSAILRTSDGYLIYDVTLSRLSWVSDDFRFLRSRSFPLALRMAVLPGGDLVYNAAHGAPASRGHFIHVADTAGNVEASFGGGGGPVDLRRGMDPLHRIIEVTRDGTIWTSRTNRYELVSFTPNGDTLAVLSRNADWFNTDAPRRPANPQTEPPNPQVVDVVSDDEGLLWVLLHVAGPDWQEAINRTTSRGEVPEQNSYLDSIIEVIDPDAGELLARTRVPEALRQVPRARRDGPRVLFYRLLQDDLGLFTVGILRANLIHQPD